MWCFLWKLIIPLASTKLCCHLEIMHPITDYQTIHNFLYRHFETKDGIFVEQTKTLKVSIYDRRCRSDRYSYQNCVQSSAELSRQSLGLKTARWIQPGDAAENEKCLFVGRLDLSRTLCSYIIFAGLVNALSCKLPFLQFYI